MVRNLIYLNILFIHGLLLFPFFENLNNRILIGYSIVFFSVVISFLFIFSNLKILNTSKFIILATIYFLLTFILSFYKYFSGISDTFGLGVLFWVPIMFFGYIVGYKHFTLNIVYFILYSFFPIILILYSISLIYKSSFGSGGDDSVFSLIIFAPFIFLMEKKIIKNMLLMILIIFFILSFKRTAILCAIIIITIHLLDVILKPNKSSIFKNLIFTIFITIVALMISFQLDQYTSGRFLFRFSLLEVDGGSGRIDIYIKIFELISNSSVSEILFGHGSLSLIPAIGFLAHNDYLNIFYDHGLFVSFLYILISICILYESFCFLKYSYYFPSFLSFAVLFVCISFFNCFMSSISWLPSFMFYCGLLLGRKKSIALTGI